MRGPDIAEFITEDEARKLACPLWSSPETSVHCKTTDCMFWVQDRSADMMRMKDVDFLPEEEGWKLEKHPFEGTVWRRWTEGGYCKWVRSIMRS